MHPFTINMSEVAVGTLAVALSLTLSFVMGTLINRWRRARRLGRSSRLRDRFRPLLAGMLTGQIEYDRGRNALNAVAGPGHKGILEQLLLEAKPPPDRLPILRRLCEELGLVENWQRQLIIGAGGGGHRDGNLRRFGIRGFAGRPGFLSRAIAAQNLGFIRHEPSWPLLVNALCDPHPEVAVVAARSLAAIGEPQSLPALVAHLHSVLLKPDTAVSLRSIKAALIRFPLERAAVLLPLLEDSNGRVRFAAVDIIREMADLRAAASSNLVLDSKTFEPELAEIFLGRLCSDENLDVRARAAGVIAHMDDPRATPALLGLLEDAQWPVRLHAVRALAQSRYVREAGVIARRLTDSHWRVREAAVATLLTFGQDGLNHLLETFLTGNDSYCKEQIAEGIHKAGLMPHIFKQRCRPVEEEAVRPVEQLAPLGRAIAQTSGDLRRLGPVPAGAASPSQVKSLESLKSSPAKH